MNVKVTLLVVTIIALISNPITHLLHVNYWEMFFIMFGAILLNGWIATWEDNRPGGFNNPKKPKDSN